MDLRGEGGGGRGRRVVVIGGGVAGSLVAKSLHFFADVILIDPKEYFEITWASLRGMVEPSFVERSVIQHKDYLTNGRVIVSKAINITASDVLIEEEGPRRRLISYDYLVIATGHHDPLPLARKDRLNEYRAENEKIKESRSVLIVGGGPTGVELAAEIAVDYPGKKVTIVHDGHRLLDFIGPKASDKAMKWLKKRGVEVRLQQSVDMESWSDGSKTYVTSTGERIDADCHFLCTGKPLGSAWLNQSILKDCVDSFGMLKVDEYLRVKGHKNIFAIGDIMDTKELKQGYLAQKHALIAAKNIKMLINGEKESKMASYNPQSLKVIVSLGRHDAVAQFPFTTIIGLVPGLIKSKDLFVGKVRKQLGLDPQIVHY